MSAASESVRPGGREVLGGLSDEGAQPRSWRAVGPERSGADLRPGTAGHTRSQGRTETRSACAAAARRAASCRSRRYVAGNLGRSSVLGVEHRDGSLRAGSRATMTESLEGQQAPRVARHSGRAAATTRASATPAGSTTHPAGSTERPDRAPLPHRPGSLGQVRSPTNGRLRLSRTSPCRPLLDASARGLSKIAMRFTPVVDVRTGRTFHSFMPHFMHERTRGLAARRATRRALESATWWRGHSIPLRHVHSYMFSCPALFMHEVSHARFASCMSSCVHVAVHSYYRTNLAPVHAFMNAVVHSVLHEVVHEVVHANRSAGAQQPALGICHPAGRCRSNFMPS